MKAIKKACSGTSLYPKSSSVSSKLKAGGKIKKAANGTTTTQTTIRPGATKDSTAYFKNKEKSFRQLSKSEKGDTEVSKFNKRFFENEAGKAVSSQVRQSYKGAPGYDANGFSIKKKKAKSGASIAKDGKWIQKAVNPKHKGYCTPMTKPTCTPRRKALAKTFKAMAAKRKGK